MARQFLASPSQADFLTLIARYIAFFGGVGSGKTACGAVKAVQKINEGEPGIIVAPDVPQLAKATFPEFMKWAPMTRCTNAHLDHPYTNKKVLFFNVRGKEVPVYYGGIENETGWAGPNVNWAWFDEAGRKKTRKAFDILAARIRIGNNPQLWITTTPNGINHWLYEIFVLKSSESAAHEALDAMGFEGEVVQYVNGSTEENKGNLDPFHYTMLTGLYGDSQFRAQELHGEFVQMSGAVWPSFDPTRNASSEAIYHHGVPIEWWIDDGFTEKHPRVILAAQVIPPFINIFDAYYAVGEHAEDSIDNALAKLDVTPSVAYVDSSAAELRSRLWQRGIDTVAATHPVDEGIKRAASWILDGHGVSHIRFNPDTCDRAVKEILSYVVDDKTGKPIKDNDHAADALRYGLWTKNRDEIFAGKTIKEPANLLSYPQRVMQSAVTLGQDRGGGLATTYAIQEALVSLNAQQRETLSFLMEAAHEQDLMPQQIINLVRRVRAEAR